MWPETLTIEQERWLPMLPDAVVEPHNRSFSCQQSETQIRSCAFETKVYGRIPAVWLRWLAAYVCFVWTLILEAALNFKDDVERLIRDELKELTEKERHQENFRRRQRERFSVVRDLLDELISGPRFDQLKIELGEDVAILEVGATTNSGEHKLDAKWTVRPNFAIEAGSWPDVTISREEPGFVVEETIYVDTTDTDTVDRSLTFDTGRQSVNYVIRKIAARIAYYRHQQNEARA